MQISKISFSPNITNNKHYIKNFGRYDTVSFGHNYHKGTVKPDDEEVLRSITNRLFDKNARIIHDRIPNSRLNTFRINRGRWINTLGVGVLHYDDKDELQYITLQKCKDGSMFDYDDLSVFDKYGQEIKHLSYEQLHVLLAYRGNISYNINTVLRYYREDNPFLREEIAVIDSLFKDPRIYSVTKEPTVVYRGIRTNTDDLEERFAPGNIYSDKAFLSTSDRPENAVPNERNLLFKIEVPKGKKYLDMHLLTCTSEFYKNEHEMLFDRNSKFIVKKYDPETQTVTMSLL